MKKDFPVSFLMFDLPSLPSVRRLRDHLVYAAHQKSFEILVTSITLDRRDTALHAPINGADCGRAKRFAAGQLKKEAAMNIERGQKPMGCSIQNLLLMLNHTTDIRCGGMTLIVATQSW